MKLFGVLFYLVCFFFSSNAQDSLTTFGDSGCYFEVKEPIRLRLQRPCEWAETNDRARDVLKRFLYTINPEKFFVEYLHVSKVLGRYTKSINDTLLTQLVEAITKDATPKGSVFVSSTKLKFDSLNGFELVYKTQPKQKRNASFRYSSIYWFVYQGYVVRLTFVIAAPQESEATQMFDSNQFLFRKLGTSIEVLAK